MSDADDDSVSRQLTRLRAILRQRASTSSQPELRARQEPRRAEDGFRVLLESVGRLAGGTRYRDMTATPDLRAALVGALAADMPGGPAPSPTA